MSAGGALKVAVSELIFQINKRALSASERGLNIMRNVAVEVLSHDGTGRRYGRHVASAPGQPPAPDSGNLRRNWSRKKWAEPNGIGHGIRITLELRSRMAYARYLDPGTRRIAQRPYKEPIRRRARPKIAALFAEI